MSEHSYFAENMEADAIRTLLPVADKVFSPQDVTKRLESLETICRILLDRVAELDGKRLVQNAAPFGYRYDLFDTKAHEKSSIPS